MKDRKRFLAAHCQAGIRTIVRFRLLDEIDKHQSSRTNSWGEHDGIITEIAGGITNHSLTRYNLDEEYILNKYGIDDVATAMLLCEIAFYQAGCDAVKTHAMPTMDYLAEVEENMEAGFFDGYQLKRVVLSHIVGELEGRALDVAGESRELDRKKDALQEFCKELNTLKDEDEIIRKMNLYNDGAYLEMAPAIRALAGLIKNSAYWEEYYRLLEVLQYFPLQGCLIKRLNNVEDVTTVIKLADARNGRKSLHYLLREQCFSLLCEEGNALAENLKNQFLTDDDRAFIKEVLDAFEKAIPGYVKDMVDIWLKVFGKEELTAWIAKKKTEAEQKHKKYAQPELSIVKMMMETYSLTSDDISRFDLEGKSFQMLITLAGKTKDKNVCAQILKALQKNIFSDKSYPPTVMNDQWFEQVRTIYHCLENSSLDGLEILKEERRPFEGFRVDLGEAMRNIRQEGYWLAMLLMSLEENGDDNRFKQYVDTLFRDSKDALESLSDDVFTPFYVAELLVSQVMLGGKDVFEKRVIEEIPYLVYVIRVLTGNDGVMSAEIKLLLKERIKNEWETERHLLNQQKKGNLKFFDEYVKEIMK